MKNANVKQRQAYSGEAFDRTTQLAMFIADCERLGGRAEPAYGYSRDDWTRAEEIVRNPVR